MSSPILSTSIPQPFVLLSRRALERSFPCIMRDIPLTSTPSRQSRSNTGWSLSKMQRRRKEIANRYISDLRIHHSFDLPVERSDVEHAWHLFPLRLRLETLRIDRDQFSAELTARNIGHSVHFIPVHVHPYYREKYS